MSKSPRTAPQGELIFSGTVIQERGQGREFHAKAVAGKTRHEKVEEDFAGS
jgi:hypothetical protein